MEDAKKYNEVIDLLQEKMGQERERSHLNDLKFSKLEHKMEEKAEQDPNYAAYLEIRNRRKREKVAILSEPNIYWNQGLTENSYGRR